MYFSSGAASEEAILDRIRAAKRTIQVMADQVRSATLIAALADGKQRGVQVLILLDKLADDPTDPDLSLCALLGIPVQADAEHLLPHSRVLMIDGEVVIVASPATAGGLQIGVAGMTLILEDKPLVMKAYQAEFNAHIEHAHPVVDQAQKRADPK